MFPSAVIDQVSSVTKPEKHTKPKQSFIRFAELVTLDGASSPLRSGQKLEYVQHEVLDSLREGKAARFGKTLCALEKVFGDAFPEDEQRCTTIVSIRRVT